MDVTRWHAASPQWDPRGRAPGAVFQHGVQKIVWATPPMAPSQVLSRLSLGQYQRVLVVNGGAAKIAPATKDKLVGLFTQVLAPLATQHNLLLIDGGTKDGIMEANGLACRNKGWLYPLLGISPGGVTELEDCHPIDSSRYPCPTEYNHHSVVLFGEGDWGSETDYMFGIVQEVTQERPSAAVICNGGGITAREALANVMQNRPIIVIRGSGRFADDLVEAIETGNIRETMIGADKIPQILARKDLVHIVSLEDQDGFRATINELLGISG